MQRQQVHEVFLAVPGRQDRFADRLGHLHRVVFPLPAASVLHQGKGPGSRHSPKPRRADCCPVLGPRLIRIGSPRLARHRMDHRRRELPRVLPGRYKERFSSAFYGCGVASSRAAMPCFTSRSRLRTRYEPAVSSRMEMEVTESRTAAHPDRHRIATMLAGRRATLSWPPPRGLLRARTVRSAVNGH